MPKLITRKELKFYQKLCKVVYWGRDYDVRNRKQYIKEWIDYYAKCHPDISIFDRESIARQSYRNYENYLSNGNCFMVRDLQKGLYKYYKILNEKA